MKLAIASVCKLSLPKGLTHKGHPVEPTGKVAIEVKLPNGSLTWVRSLDDGRPEPTKPRTGKEAAQKPGVRRIGVEAKAEADPPVVAQELKAAQAAVTKSAKASPKPSPASV